MTIAGTMTATATLIDFVSMNVSMSATNSPRD